MQTDETKTDWPLWKVALRNLRALPGFGFGLKLETRWFEAQLGCSRETSEFAFGMMRLRQEVEEADGYYLQCQTIQDDESGAKCEVYQIPSAADHQGVAVSFEARMRSYAARSLQIRTKTLNNPTAQLSESDRARMAKSEEIAATRIVLLRRERTIAKVLKASAPKLLEDK